MTEVNNDLSLLVYYELILLSDTAELLNMEYSGILNCHILILFKLISEYFCSFYCMPFSNCYTLLIIWHKYLNCTSLSSGKSFDKFFSHVMHLPRKQLDIFPSLLQFAYQHACLVLFQPFLCLFVKCILCLLLLTNIFDKQSKKTNSYQFLFVEKQKQYV